MKKISLIFKKAPIFLKEVRREVKKISWLNRKEVLTYTITVIAISLAVAVFLGGLDFLFTTLLNKFIFEKTY